MSGLYPIVALSGFCINAVIYAVTGPQNPRGWIFFGSLMLATVAADWAARRREADNERAPAVTGAQHLNHEKGYSMSIIAKYSGLCRICGKGWEPGERIGRWLGHEAHFFCRQEEIARRAAEGETKQLPEARGWADRPAMTAGKKTRRRYVSLGAVRWQDGRSQDGRFQSKPDPS